MTAIRVRETVGIGGLVFEEAPDAKPFSATCWSRSPRAASPTTNWTIPSGPAVHHEWTLIIPSAEMSGVVAALGSGTAGIAVSEEVFGLTDQWRDGTATEYVAVEARNVAPKPQTVVPQIEVLLIESG